MHYFSLLGEDHVYIYILELVAYTCCQYDDSPSCSAHPKEILRAACTNQHQVGYGAWLLWFKKLPILAESHQPIHKIDVSIHIYIYIHTYIHTCVWICDDVFKNKYTYTHDVWISSVGRMPHMFTRNGNGQSPHQTIYLSHIAILHVRLG